MTFDARAATWDDDPDRRRLAQAIVGGILRDLPAMDGKRLLDVGCGTGLVGLPLATGAASLLGVDLSEGMIERFRTKGQALGFGHVRAELRDLVACPLPASSVDIAVSAMALHHVQDPRAMIASVASCLVDGGFFALADLETEDGSFHDSEVPHHGFDPGQVAAWFEAEGLGNTRITRVHVIRKLAGEFMVFLVVGRKG